MGLSKQDWYELIKIAIGLSAFISAFIAYRTYRANLSKLNEDRVRERDKELLAQAQRCLEWAFDALTDNGENVPPKADRLNWLTCARHLLRGSKLASQITSATYKLVYAEVEEFWRHRFYMTLNHESLQSSTYFADQSHRDDSVNIEVRSALVIIDFTAWKENAVDPMDEVDRVAMVHRVSRNGRPNCGLADYIDLLEEQKRARQPQEVTRGE